MFLFFRRVAEEEVRQEEEEAPPEASHDRHAHQVQDWSSPPATLDAFPGQILRDCDSQSDHQRRSLLARFKEKLQAVKSNLLRARPAPAPLRPRRRSRHLG